ncbi:DUF1822 family protein [Microcoleus sp. CAWBG58]|uniref:DUF1822 family protein n=1 Tax=Microcoleus sp. CAWBG58 TaxID=2841651 RepID=UPI0025FFCCE0|nr:DUF1822 family protein [Microcoleus sp. CAWBG58]
MIYESETDLWIPLPITEDSKRLAQQFATNLPNPQKAEQVYLNTLAVCTVNNYLRIVGIPTNLNAGNSWNSAARLLANVADLEVTGLGTLECRPMRKSDRFCYVPAEVQDERLGYIVVQIDEEEQQATLLGFTPSVESEELLVSDLRSIDDFLEYLVLPTPQTAKQPIDLNRWLQNIFDAGWETVEMLLNPPQLGFRGETAVAERPTQEAIDSVIGLTKPDRTEAVRRQAAGVLGEMGTGNVGAVSALVELLQTAQDLETRWQAALSLGKISPHHPQAGIRRARAIDLGLELDGYTVALILAIMPQADGRISVFLEVEPAGNLAVLPPNLKLKVLSDTGETRLEVSARSDELGRGKDRSIGKRFTPPPGACFQVQVELNDVIFTEVFAV